MLAFLAARKKLWAVGGLWGGLLLAAFDVYAAIVTYIPQYAIRNDFRLMYGAALVTERLGYAHLYDLGAQQAAVQSLGPSFYYSPFINPPPLVWLVTPLTALPFGVAIVVWTGIVLGALGIAWWLAAPGDRLSRAAFAAMGIGLFPVAFGVMVGQPVALVVGAVAACWWLVTGNHQWAAGLVLAVVAVKPQLALLVPPCLLVAGYWRAFVALLGPTAVVALASFALLGFDGWERYRDALNLAAGWEITRSFAVSGLIGVGPQLYVSAAVALGAALLAAWRWRGQGPEIPIAAGIAGSLLLTPYVGFQDFAMLVLAGWLVVRAQPNAWQTGLLVAGYVLLELCLLVQSIPILACEVLLLASLIYWAPGRRATHSAPFAQNVPIEQAPDASFAQNVRN